MTKDFRGYSLLLNDPQPLPPFYSARYETAWRWRYTLAYRSGKVFSLYADLPFDDAEQALTDILIRISSFSKLTHGIDEQLFHEWRNAL